MEVKPGYKLTELGVIPDDWETAAFADVTSKILDYRGRTPRKLGMDWGGGDIPALSAGNVKMGHIDFDEECYLGSEALYRRWMTNGHASKGDIVFTTEAPLGNSAQIPDDRKYILSQRTILLQLNSETTDGNFMFQFLKSSYFQNVLADNATGSTAKGIQRKRFEQLRLVWPPLHEQRAVAAALSDADALLAKLDRLIAKKRDLKQAQVHQLLTGETRLPGFSGVWETRRVSSFSSFITKGATPTTYGFGWEPSGVIFLRSECVSANGLDLNQSMFISEQAHSELIRGEVRPGDILITITGNVGRVVLLDERVGVGNINQHIARIRVNDASVSPSFVFHWLSQPAVRHQYSTITTGQAYPQISLQQVRSTLIPLGSLAEQSAIAIVLSDMDSDLAALEARRDKTQLIKQGMMQELLTGMVRLI